MSESNLNPGSKNDSFSKIIKVIRGYFFGGIAVLLPLAITAYILVFSFNAINRFVNKYINSFLVDKFGYSIPALGFIVLLGIIVLAGFLSRNFLGNRILVFFDKLLSRIPLVQNIYPATKQLSDFLFTKSKKEKFKKVVLVEYPLPGSFSLGFVTNEEVDIIDNIAENKLVHVLVPLAPAPFSGILLMVPKEKIKPLDISIEEAIKFVVSGGVVAEFNKTRLKEKEG